MLTTPEIVVLFLTFGCVVWILYVLTRQVNSLKEERELDAIRRREEIFLLRELQEDIKHSHARFDLVNACLEELHVRIHESETDLQKDLTALDKKTRHALQKQKGHLDRAVIQSKISEKVAMEAQRMSHDATADVKALQRSTHKVHFIPAEDALLKNGMAEEQINKLFNPSGEKFDWMNGIEEGDENIDG